MSTAGSGAGEGVVLDLDAPAANLDDGHRPVKQQQQLDMLAQQDTTLSNSFNGLAVVEEDLTPRAGPSSPPHAHPADLVSSNHPDARNGNSLQFSNDHDRQTSGGSKESYSTCTTGEVQSSTSSSANALEDGDDRLNSASQLSVDHDAQRVQDGQSAQPKATDFAQSQSTSASPHRIPSAAAQRLQDSPVTDSYSPVPTPNSEEIIALKMSGRDRSSGDPYQGSSSSSSASNLSPSSAPKPLLSSRPSTSQSTRVPSNQSHDPLHNGEVLVDEGHTDYQPIPLVELALHGTSKTAAQHRSPIAASSSPRVKGASTQAQNGHEPSDNSGDPFVASSPTSRRQSQGLKQVTTASANADLRREQEDEFAETLATSSPTSNRANLFHTNGAQNLTDSLGSPSSLPRSPRSSMQKNRGEGSTAASTGHHTSSSSIGYRRPSADSNAPLAAGSSTSARPSHGHELSSSNSHTGQSVFAQQQAAPPFSQTVPATEVTKDQSGEKQSKSSSSRDKERDQHRIEGQTNGRERGERSSRRQLGEWTLGKTLGAGSMGKVKLGVSTITGDKVNNR